MGIGRNLVLGKFPKIHELPRLRLSATVERVHNSSFFCNLIDEYNICEHTAFIQLVNKIDAC